MTVKILFWNDTNSKDLRGTQVRIGSAVFKPDTSVTQTRGSLGPIEYDKPIELVVYPDGPTGKKILVPVTVTRQMVPNSEQDGIQVAISDGTVRVLGNPVVDVDRSQPRF